MDLPQPIVESFTDDYNTTASASALRYGVWHHSCDPCYENCLLRHAHTPDDVVPTRVWGWQVLMEQLNSTFDQWSERGGFTPDHLVSLNSCAYKTRTRWNPHGLWLHISGRTVTTLRMLADGYRRAEHIKLYIKDVVARSPTPFRTPVVVYVSVTDIPCNTRTPYLTFFGQQGNWNIVIPDNSFYSSTHGSWEETRGRLLARVPQHPFEARKNRLFFRGSPTHSDRENLRRILDVNHSQFADIKLAVVERFKAFAVRIEDHMAYRYLLAVRGKTASSRDKYLLLLGSAIVWAADETPWFQFYHALWKPYYNYIPITESTAGCVASMLQKPESVAAAAKIARRSLQLGEFLSQEAVDEYMLLVLQRYAALQTFRVHEDPIEFLKWFHRFVKKRYRSALVMPDDPSPVKFFFERWLSRRMKQLQSCRTNNTYNGVQLPEDSKYRCWY